jgi:hypothetical protein
MPMYCPRCLTEYRDGFIECADCRVPLASGPVPQSPDAEVMARKEHSVSLVTVLESGDQFVLALAKAALEDAGIDYVLEGANQKFTGGYPGTFGVGAIPFGGSSSRIQVAQESEAEARTLLEPFQKPDAIRDVGPESDQDS